ncbi:hypothetical protein [Sinisalibacter aestuarii]|uniref:Uncharacterized protein n=1 Tax=Sinisalibacter aestuarii TaxID=2949426 RepID=A0ABQ5LQ29_9RHOB|nr:hypothetical protein [Sinisalibacter aestuarii]GKY87105.1 hypothetical protein STA1M1_09740 [Sinisalibacter aestuarii]
MQNAFVAAADEFVGEGMRKSGIALTETLRHYIAITLARFMRDNPRLDRLTIRTVAAFEARAPDSALRQLGDECLIATSLFEARLRRAGGSLRHYMGLGQTAYDAAAMTEQAFCFPHMRDVIVSATGTAPRPLSALVDAARGGSTLARAELERGNVVPFPARRWIG